MRDAVRRGSAAMAGVAALLAATAAPARAQPIDRCVLPDRIETPFPARPRGTDRPRRVPHDGYLLSLSWSPTYCAASRGDARDRLQCDGTASRHGFILHGLWPDARGRDDPRWCRPARLVPQATLRASLCRTPSVSLIQREWAKHGTCMSPTPAAYFKAAGILYDAVRFPDMTLLSRRAELTAGGVADAFAAANRGVAADMVAVGTRGGLLSEVRFCLDRRMRPTRCRADQRLARRSERVVIRR